MASRSDESHDPVVVETEDGFTGLPTDERIRLTDEWLASLAEREPIEITITGAELLAEARAEMGW